MTTARTRRLLVPAWLAALLVAPGVVGAVEPAGEPAMSPDPAAVPQSLLLEFLVDKSAFTLVDARSPEEYAESHIDGAINIPHDRLDQYDDALPESLAGTVVVYCRTGRRAGELRARLAERGYTDVRVLGPEQIFSSGDLMVFNCGTSASNAPAAAVEAPVDEREEERER